jgi:hypothetical protein
MEPQRIADIVQTNGVGQLGEEQADDMAPGTKRAGLLGDPGFPGQLGPVDSREKDTGGV